ncbi:MAG: hypothetical protein HQM12_18880 [SAR324 cluster bacterium]|nr:hypothetical protein [SAR324 cluster bacterium]
MNKNKLKAYAPRARQEFIQAITERAHAFGISENQSEPMTVQGDTVIIGGKTYPKRVAEQRRKLEARIQREGFAQVMEAVAYTWFNRFVAIRYMELHDFLEHGFRVLSHPEGKAHPQILEEAQNVELPGLRKDELIEMKLDGNRDAELYRRLLLAQCNALQQALPFLFEAINDETELLLPDNLLHTDSLLRKLVNDIEESDWQEVEVIGWLYQFYISEKKDAVIGKVVKSEDIPAATQLFTPKWIVRYMVQNSLGRLWLATYPNSSLRGKYLNAETQKTQRNAEELGKEKINAETQSTQRNAENFLNNPSLRPFANSAPLRLNISDSNTSVPLRLNNLESNLKFIADNLSPKKGELPKETIRRYLSQNFFKDHLKRYKKRPIYWLFSSGKHRAFEGLVYLHRYNAATLSRMRTEYVTPLQGKFMAREQYLRDEIEKTASASIRKQYQKELDVLLKKQGELVKFDDLLRHYADQRITLDLDDGVKVNYGKFGELLDEVKAVTGGSEE